LETVGLTAGACQQRANLLCSILDMNFGELPFRSCMKSGSRMVFRYSSMHEKTLPDGSLRRRMELHPASHVPAPKGHGRPRTHSLREILNAVFCVLKSAVVNGTCCLTTSLQMAHRLPLLQKMAHRRYLGEYQPSHPQTPAGSLEQRSSEPSAGVEDSQGRSRAPRWAEKTEVTTAARRWTLDEMRRPILRAVPCRRVCK
jgi:hypothetical protein